MITYRVGDLIAAATDPSNDYVVVAHCCNCFNMMKSGIAPQIAKAFPEAYRIDQLTTQGDKVKLGDLTEAWSANNNVLVYNLYGQYGFFGRREGKRDLDYDALEHSLHKMALSLHSKCRLMDLDPRELNVFLPKIGAGLAGGDWEIISEIIERRLIAFNVTVFTLK